MNTTTEIPLNRDLSLFQVPVSSENGRCLKHNRSRRQQSAYYFVWFAADFVGVAMVARYTRALSGELAVEEFQRSWSCVRVALAQVSITT